MAGGMQDRKYSSACQLVTCARKVKRAQGHPEKHEVTGNRDFSKSLVIEIFHRPTTLGPSQKWEQTKPATSLMEYFFRGENLWKNMNFDNPVAVEGQ